MFLMSCHIVLLDVLLLSVLPMIMTDDDNGDDDWCAVHFPSSVGSVCG